MKIAFIACVLLSVCVDCCSVQFGHWYGGGVKQRVDSIGLDAGRADIVKRGLTSRNLLLSDEGKMYINNMYPINSYEYLQLTDVLREKQLINEDTIHLLSTMPEYGENCKSNIEAFYIFAEAVMKYLRVFGMDDKVAGAILAMQKVQQLCQGEKTYQTLCCVKNYLNNKNNMALVWDFMHTEFLYVFHSYYKDDSVFGRNFLSSRILSHYDMCERCEQLMSKLSEHASTDKYRGSDDREECYGILVASFEPYYGSREREGSQKQLLKVIVSSNFFH